ncbi:MAG: hypothetical protein LBF09_02620 [Odoribacteraceae bacterium]|nr:hypothetical protein [Odoribacteraceae bacterium]
MKKFLTLLTGWLLLVTCQRGEVAAPGGELPRGGFVLDYVIPQSRVSTYGTIPAEAGEDQVNSLYVLFFQETTGGTGNFLGYYQVPTTDDDGEPVPLSASGQIRVDFKDITVTEDPAVEPPVTFTPDGTYSLLIAANVDGFLDEGMDALAWISDMQGKSENLVLATCLLKVRGAADEQDNGHTIQGDNLPMSARVKRNAGQNTVSVELRRSVCRVDVRSEVPAGYKLVSASIWNAYPTSPAWENVLTDYKASRLKRLYGVTTTTPEIIGKLYALENGTSASAPADEVTTCLILGFQQDPGDDIYYYRANINVTDVGQRLQRNNVYRLNVKGIHGPGELCELDAYTSQEFLLDVTVNEWNLDDQGGILSDGNNVLAVPTRVIVFTPVAESRSYSIYTSGPGTLEMSQSRLPAGITANLDGHTLTVAVTANEEEREGYIELRMGDLKVLVSIKQTGNLDKYIDLSRYDVPPFPGNGVYQMEGDVQVSSSGPWSAKIHGAGFTFQFRGSAAESPVELSHYPTGETFMITTLGTNPTTDPRYAFVSVYLDEDPDVHQVLVLSQNGRTSYNFSPVLTGGESLAFDAAGTRTSGREKFNVVIDGQDDEEWQASIPYEYADRFVVRYYDKDGTLQSGATSGFGTGYFDIVPTINTTGVEISTNVEVALLDNQDSRQTIPLTQGKFTLTLPNFPTTVTAMGDTRTINVSLSPALTGAAWEAEITSSTRSAAYFGTIVGTNTASGSMSQTMTLSYPKLPVTYMHDGASTDITVTIAAAGISEDLTVQQSAAAWRAINIQSYHTSDDGNLTPPASSVTKFDHFNHFYYAINNIYFDSYSPTGTVRTKELITMNTGYSYLATLAGGIINMNLSTSSYSSSISTITTWLNQNVSAMYNQPANFMILLGDDHPDASQRKSMVSSVLGVDCYDNPSANTARRTAVAAPVEGTSARKVWDYVMVNGPFGPVTPGNISIISNDSYIGVLGSNKPSTTVSLLNYPDGRTEIAIDPVKRLLFIGNIEVFGTIQNPDASMNTDEHRFMRNIIAFIINAAQYGEYFLSDFK